MARTLLERLRENIPLFGFYMGDTDSSVAEMAAYAGFDYMRIDCEHTLMSAHSLREIIRIADAADLPTMIRISTPEELTRVLDFGGTGIMVPDVSTREQAEAAVRHTKYLPLGERGMTNISRCLRYGTIPMSSYVKEANDRICLAVQIESREGVENVDDILSVPGIDVVSVGRQDLSQSLGIPGQGGHPDVVAAENKVVESALRHGVYPLLTVSSPEQFLSMQARGINCVTICFDAPFIIQAFQNHITKFRDAAGLREGEWRGENK